MSQYVETPTKSFTAGAAIAQFLRVYLSSGKLAVAGATQRAIGTIEQDVFADGDRAPVRLRTAQGTRKMVAAAAITAGVKVYAAASGRIDDIGFLPVGIALEAATAAGDIIEVLDDGADEPASAAAALAATGTVLANAAAIVHRVTTVSAADNTKGVLLPTPSAAGVRVEVYNEEAANGLKIYPHSGGDINDGTANAAIVIEGKTLAEFLALDTSTWAAQFTVNA